MAEPEPVGLSGESIAWLTVSREIEEILGRGFWGEIVLTCQDGVVKFYDVKDRRKPGRQRRDTGGPRDGEDRRQGD